MKMKGWRALVYGVSFVACLSLAGCFGGTHRFYKGPHLPKEQVAHLTNKDDKAIRLLAVDGKYGPHGKTFGFSSSWNNFFDLEIPPGQYKLTLWMYTYASKSVVRAEPVIVELKVEPGQTYRFVAKLDIPQAAYRVVVVDRTSSAVLDEGPFSMGVFPSGRASGRGRGGLTPEQANEIIRRTLPPPAPPRR
jgi:hypothetical protein